MKNKFNRQQGNFSTLLLGNYIVFTLLIIITIIFIFIVSLLRIRDRIIKNDPNLIFEYQHLLENQQFDQFPVEIILGDDGYFVVLDQNNLPIFISGNDNTPSYFTKSEINYIPLYTNYSSIETNEFYNSDNEKQIVVSIDYIDINNELIREEYILDDKLNILYQSEKGDKKHFTAREYALLTDNLNSEYSITRYPFYSANMDEYNLILFKSHARNNILAYTLTRILWDSLFSFITIYCLLIGFFIFWLNRKVKKPIRLLHSAIRSLADGERQQYLSYQGPKEFTDICASFNNMSHQLYKSEVTRLKLEQERQKMLADISHDLKTPITVILGYAKAINDGLLSTEEAEQYLSTIENKAEALNELINTFYNYSKLEHPDYSLTLEKYDICVFLRDFMAEKYNELDLSGFELDVDIPENHIYCSIDRFQLTRALNNLIDNSLKHNNSGTTVFVELKSFGKHIEVTIADNGVGIPSHIGSTVFEPFVVGEKSRNKQGSGLGLAVTKKIIEAHKGSIKLIDSPEMFYKTQFQIILPTTGK